jgi:hypothetical protein
MKRTHFGGSITIFIALALILSNCTPAPSTTPNQLRSQLKSRSLRAAHGATGTPHGSAGRHARLVEHGIN